MMAGCELGSYGSEQGPDASFREHEYNYHIQQKEKHL